ncbi:hypothetical protein BYT27DRAFT_7199263 [Phlegmacium glaucopus]|nr:hypothetical protein BYT27DRAFT_7199263 [Phlegmacium glaucopus]
MPVIHNAIARIAKVQGRTTGRIHKHIFQQLTSWGPSVVTVAGMKLYSNKSWSQVEVSMNHCSHRGR